MHLSILSPAGQSFLFRWIHILAGLTWIGLLYYFNFVQTPFMAEADAATKPGVTRKLVPRALWWFRWGAMWTFLTGLFMLHTAGYVGFSLHGDWGVKILTGAAFGTLMWFNVWFVIWPNPKIIIKSAERVAGGGQPLPNVANLAARALVASRTNTLFSIPMLFYMIGGAHLPIQMDMNNQMAYYIALAVLLVVLEGNALKGKLGPMTTVKGVISCGFALAAVVYGMMEVIL